MIVWSKKMHEEKAIVPGTDAWRAKRAEMKDMFSEAWQDCVELANHIEKHQEFCNDAPEGVRSLVQRTAETRPSVEVHPPAVPEACVS